MIDAALLVARFGVLAVALGAGLEGEAAVVTGGALAAAGLFPPIAAWLAAFAGSATMDQLLFLLGRRASHSRFVAKVRARPLFARLLGWVEARPTLVVLGFRFVYGTRVAGPIALGVSAVLARRFVPLNLLAAAIWAAIFTFVGWRFWPVVEPLLKRAAAQLYGPVGLALALVAVAIMLWVVRRQFRQA